MIYSEQPPPTVTDSEDERAGHWQQNILRNVRWSRRGPGPAQAVIMMGCQIPGPARVGPGPGRVRVNVPVTNLNLNGHMSMIRGILNSTVTCRVVQRCQCTSDLKLCYPQAEPQARAPPESDSRAEAPGPAARRLRG